MTFQTGLRGYHVYKQIWRPYVPQLLEFSQERDNVHDEFAVAGYARLPGIQRICVVGHIPPRIFHTYLVCPEYGCNRNWKSYFGAVSTVTTVTGRTGNSY